MEKQYNDLIISLIKDHAKYPGHEDLLNEIAEDVYQHARVVINSVTNEDVIASYLAKVVSNSIVTVGKRNNINVRPKHTVKSVLSSIETSKSEASKILEQQAAKTTVIQPKKESNPSPIMQEDLELELNLEESLPETSTLEQENTNEDKIILEENSTSELLSEDSVIEQKTEIIIETTVETVVEEVATETLEVVNEDDDAFVDKLYSEPKTIEAAIKEELPDADIIETKIEEPEEKLVTIEAKPDMELVDKMINGVKKEEETPIQNQETEVLEVAEDVFEDFETLDIVEVEGTEDETELEIDNNLGEELVLETDDTLEESSENVVEFAKNVANSVLLEEAVISDNTEETLLTPEIEDCAEDLVVTETLSFEEDSVENFDDTLSLTQEENSELLEFEEAIDEEIEDSLVEIEATEETTETLEFDSVTDDLVEPQSISSSQENTTDTDARYSKFAFEPSKEDSIYNSDEIISILKEYNSKHPEQKVFEVSKMKYAEKKSISEIAKSLGFDEDKVIEILNEIIDLVKD